MLTSVMSTLHASIMVRHGIKIVDMLIIRPVVLLGSRDIRHHVHLGEWKVYVDCLLAECRAHVGISVETLEMNHQNRRKLRNVEFLDRFSRLLAMRAVPTPYHLSVKVHVEALVDMATLDVVWRQLQTKVGEGFVSGAFVRAHGALDCALDLPVEKSKNERFSRFCVL